MEKTKRNKARVLVILAIGAALALTMLASCLKLGTRTEPIKNRVVAPDFELEDQMGQSVSLASLLADGPAIVVFYRGYW